MFVTGDNSQTAVHGCSLGSMPGTISDAVKEGSGEYGMCLLYSDILNDGILNYKEGNLYRKE